MGGGVISDLYPKRQKYRWEAVPPGAELREIRLHPKWVDLLWKDETRNLWVYIASRPNTDEP